MFGFASGRMTELPTIRPESPRPPRTDGRQKAIGYRRLLLWAYNISVLATYFLKHFS
jgi:hypothetical protein